MLHTKREILRHVGDAGQLFGIKQYTLTGGRANGVRALDVKNGTGLDFTVLPDRCLDIAGLSFKGTNCGYASNTGIVAPEYYEKEADGFLRNFFSGFLTTCGLRNVGPPCRDRDEWFSQHGRIANIAAEEVCTSTEWIDNVPVMTIRGKMREACFFGEYLLLSRKISCRYGENRIVIRNTVENAGFRKEALMLLFHFNIGYPLLDENAYLVIPAGETAPRDPEAETATCRSCQKPTPAYREQVFYHRLNADEEGHTGVAFINRELGMAVALRFNTNQFFNFTQWKQMGEGAYVMGLEPCNCYVGGRTDPRNAGLLDCLEPGETRNFDITVDLLQGDDEIDLLEQQIRAL
ncbi:MAG: aldose 1-epimerase family protein [Tannerella sp.]|nr:aldose 1-epimerase family protein [Tannerella sp.]